MTETRRPSAFKLTPGPSPDPEPKRAPRAMAASEAAVVVPAEVDVFDADGLDALAPPEPLKPRPASKLGLLFFSALATLLSLALGLWAERVVRDLFGRSDWLGWLGVALAGTIVATFLAILVRELYALARLSSVEALRDRTQEAILADDAKTARAAVADLIVLVGKKPETAAGRRAVVDLKGEVIDGADFIRYAETEILTPLDERAKELILDAAKRVSIVTAVSPRALVDLGYVLWEAGRLVRRMSELYGGRPGTLGFFRLTRSVLAHLAVTGSIAAGDSLVQQLVGHGLAARISAKLGEGVVNGMMTVRIGIAAMEAARPFPFSAVKRPGMGDFASVLATFASRKREDRPGQNE